ncbi:hypothetical protein NP493_560g01127 [Ridgeia piscesae]|uniref:Uncharacterized protein n=1 Tax=Ridgeia piscesae TaxID=27915 RepID=A0AAD9KVF4_RIDPI|nr:hypothetical protein NP493_560g01127 [Ridgeia piscesae]
MASCFRVRLLRSKNSYDIADPYSDTYSSRESYHRTASDSSAWQLVYDGTRWTNEPVGGGSNSRPVSSGLNGSTETSSHVVPVASSPVKALPPISDEAAEAANTSCDVEAYEGVDLEYEADSLTGTWDARPNHEAHEEMKQRASLILEQRSSSGTASDDGTTKPNETNNKAGERENETQPLENGVDGASDEDVGTSERDAGDVHEQTTPEVRQHESWRPVPAGAYSVRFDVPDSGDSDNEDRITNGHSLDGAAEESENRANEAHDSR